MILRNLVLSLNWENDLKTLDSSFADCPLEQMLKVEEEILRIKPLHCKRPKNECLTLHNTNSLALSFMSCHVLEM